MVERRKILLVLIGALALSTAVRADMVPLSPVGAGNQPSRQARVPADSALASCSGPIGPLAESAGPDSLSLGFLLGSTENAGHTSETKPAQILSDRQNSLSLFLYALLGFGLCRSAPFVKKLHFTCIPDWYHSGGPSQIGHSFAVSPDCLSPVPIYCLVQPGCEPKDISPRYFHGTIASLLRKSQLTFLALGSRGPPNMSWH